MMVYDETTKRTIGTRPLTRKRAPQENQAQIFIYSALETPRTPGILGTCSQWSVHPALSCILIVYWILDALLDETTGSFNEYAARAVRT